MAAVGFVIPGDIKVYDGSNEVTTEQLFAGKKVVLFGLPGAFTPGCTKTHLPGYVNDYEKFKEKGIDEIYCLTVNDFFVCNAWKDFVGANDKVHVLADPFANFTKVLGLDIDTPFAGIRCKRFSAIVENGVITIFNLEEGGYGLTCSLSNALLSAL